MSLHDPNPIGTADGERVPVTLAKSLDRDRTRGALLGLAVGDALGTTLEFTRPKLAPWSPPLTGPHRAVTGGGPFHLAPGQVTDDTQMATCLAASLMANGLLDVDDVAGRYVRWKHHAFDIGNQTRDALTAVERGVAPLDAGRQVWLAGGGRAAGNGSLMRTAPIGLFNAHIAVNRRIASTLDSAITHFDPRCQLACAAFNTALAAAVKEQAAPAEMVAAARAELEDTRKHLGGTMANDVAAVDAAAADLARDLDAAAAADPALAGPELHLLDQAGFVRVAFRLAFWQLLHATSFEAALVDVVNRGGDADTNGAITGALLGAAFGESSIPAAWRQTVVDALAGQPGPLATSYHPRRLLELAP